MPRKSLKLGPRKYGLKSNYTAEILEEALDQIRSGNMSRLEAAEHYKIPRVTLFYRLKDKHNKPVGRPLTFKKEEEESFKSHLLLLSELGIPISMMDLRVVVKHYLNSNGITIPQFRNNLPGYEWGGSFLERNPDLKERLSQTNNSRKRSSINQEMIEEFFTNMATKIDGVSPENIYNMDEIGFLDDPTKFKLLFRRNSRYPDIMKNSAKSCYTVIFCSNASGKVLPPFIIFKGKKLWPNWLFQTPSGSNMSASESGWINTSIFEYWMEKHFIPYVKKQDGRKLLLCDNLSAHISPKAFRLCNEYNITIISLIPNASHLLQPLNVGYFSALKRAWRKVLNEYRQFSEGKKAKVLPQSLFTQLLQKALRDIEVTSSNNIKAGFRSCGLHPFSLSAVLNKLQIYTSHKIDIRDSMRRSFMKILEEVNKEDSNKDLNLPVSAEKYKETSKKIKQETVIEICGQPVGSQNKNQSSILKTVDKAISAEGSRSITVKEEEEEDDDDDDFYNEVIYIVDDSSVDNVEYIDDDLWSMEWDE